MQKIKTSVIFTLLVTSFFLLINCATRKGPSGGPVDRIPPQVIKTIPAKDSLFVPDYLSQIDIVFSERMEQSSLSRNVFISPPLEFEVSWRNWEEAQIKLNEPLVADQTYVISIASGVQDLRKNSMATSYQFAFSTGSALDRNSINGKVHGLSKDNAVKMFAFLLDSLATFHPDSLKPMYITKSGKDGIYRLAYMKDGRYRVLAVEDQNNNLLLDADFEQFGIPTQDVSLDSLQSEFSGLDFVLTKNDTMPPQLLGVRPVYRDLIEVRLTEPIIGDSIQGLIIRDSLSNQILPIYAIQTDKEFDNILNVLTSDPDTNSTYQLLISSIVDSAFNKNDTLPSFYYYPKTAEDTITFRLLKHVPQDSSLNIHPTDIIQLEFSTPISADSLRKYHVLKNVLGNKVAGAWKLKSLNEAQFIPDQPLRPDSAYFSMIHTDSLKDLRGKTLADSVISHYFKIVSSRELGEVSGSIQFEHETEAAAILLLKPLAKKQKNFEMDSDASSNFRQEMVPDGKYLLEGWLDEDLNGRHNAGTVFPFQFAEPFTTSMDTVIVRKRWETENILFRLPVPERKNEKSDSLQQN